jgi:hypothetical protein
MSRLGNKQVSKPMSESIAEYNNNNNNILLTANGLIPGGSGNGMGEWKNK